VKRNDPTIAGGRSPLIPTPAARYVVLSIIDATDVVVEGGTLEGHRAEQLSKGGIWGMGSASAAGRSA
jgi:hypothetical protein